MTNLVAVSELTDVPQLETSTLALAGPGAVMNAQAQALLNRQKHHTDDTANPHAVTKAQVGLGDCDNTSDADKPVSTAQQAALDAKQDAAVVFNNQTGTTYTLVLADSIKYLRMDNAAAITLTVPPNADVAIPAGSTCHVRQVGTGQVTVAAGAGVTILTPETLKLRKAGSIVSLTKVATDTWEIYGDLEAA